MVAGDALLEAEVWSTPAHVESPQAADCGAQHDHVFCQMVRSLSSVLIAPHQATARTGSAHFFAAPPTQHARVTLAALPSGVFGPRGPPSI